MQGPEIQTAQSVRRQRAKRLRFQIQPAPVLSAEDESELVHQPVAKPEAVDFQKQDSNALRPTGGGASDAEKGEVGVPGPDQESGREKGGEPPEDRPLTSSYQNEEAESESGQPQSAGLGQLEEPAQGPGQVPASAKRQGNSANLGPAVTLKLPDRD